MESDSGQERRQSHSIRISQHSTARGGPAQICHHGVCSGKTDRHQFHAQAAQGKGQDRKGRSQSDQMAQAGALALTN